MARAVLRARGIELPAFRSPPSTSHKAALEALAHEDLAVAATTAALDPAVFDVPPNARVERFLPHVPILTRAACVVSHDGQGITQKSLAAAVPVCGVPFCRDQFEVARRVEVSGAGVRLHPSASARNASRPPCTP